MGAAPKKIDWQALVEAARAGDRKAQKALIEQTRWWVKKLVAPWVRGCPHEKEDAEATAWLGWSEALATWRPGGRTFLSWVHVRVHNAMRRRFARYRHTIWAGDRAADIAKAQRVLAEAGLDGTAEEIAAYLGAPLKTVEDSLRAMSVGPLPHLGARVPLQLQVSPDD